MVSETKDIMMSAVRGLNGGDPAQINALYFLTDCASGGGLAAHLNAAVGSAQEYKIKVWSCLLLNTINKAFS